MWLAQLRHMRELPLQKRSERTPGMSLQSWCAVLRVPYKGKRKEVLQVHLAAALRDDMAVLGAVSCSLQLLGGCGHQGCRCCESCLCGSAGGTVCQAVP
jgi:hypothetical protein